jgi:CheY-like chemotaxis protein
MLQAAPAALSAASLRVLHVDDDPIEHGLVAGMLERTAADTEIRHVRTVPQALRALQASPADVVLLGAVAGHDPLDQLLRPRVDLPVVVLTGADDPDVGGIGRGADEVLTRRDLDPTRLWSALVRAHARWQRIPTWALRADASGDGIDVGTVLDRYVVEGVIGRGGTAVVYRVRHRTLGSEHALKVAPGRDDRRLLREGQAQARLQHPNLVMVTDVLELAGPAGRVGLVMEYVQGPTLLQWMRQGRIPAVPWLDLFRGIVRGVRHAHARGVVHRDLKPANVLLQVASDPIVPKVTDFGIARAPPGADAPESDLAWSVHQPGLGTPGYMAPEQVRDAASVDARADLFSLGCILYDLACGRSAFRGAHRKAILDAATRAVYRDAAAVAPGLPPQVVEVIDGLLTVDPGDRIPDCDTLLSALEGVSVDTVADPGAPAPGERYLRWRSTATAR